MNKIKKITLGIFILSLLVIGIFLFWNTNISRKSIKISPSCGPFGVTQYYPCHFAFEIIYMDNKEIHYQYYGYEIDRANYFTYDLSTGKTQHSFERKNPNINGAEKNIFIKSITRNSKLCGWDCSTNYMRVNLQDGKKQNLFIGSRWSGESVGHFDFFGKNIVYTKSDGVYFYSFDRNILKNISRTNQNLKDFAPIVAKDATIEEISPTTKRYNNLGAKFSLSFPTSLKLIVGPINYHPIGEYFMSLYKEVPHSFNSLSIDFIFLRGKPPIHSVSRRLQERLPPQSILPEKFSTNKFSGEHYSYNTSEESREGVFIFISDEFTLFIDGTAELSNKEAVNMMKNTVKDIMLSVTKI